MFPALQTDIVDRIFRVHQFINEACDSSANPQTAVASKGMVFVLLYAVYEHAVVTAVQYGFATICQHGFSYRDLRQELLPILLEPELQSITNVGPAKKWINRAEMFRRTFCAENASVPDQFFPGDGSHFRIGQLETIWSIFGLTSSPVPEGHHRGLIDELVEHRNAIAHGRELPESIGGRFSLTDLQARTNRTQTLCLHITAEIAQHCSVAGNLRRN